MRAVVELPSIDDRRRRRQSARRSRLCNDRRPSRRSCSAIPKAGSPVRAFPEKGDASRPPRTPFLAADAELAASSVAEAEEGDENGLALYVVPGTVSGPGKAKAGDVVAMETVLVDLDHGDVAANVIILPSISGRRPSRSSRAAITEQGQERLHLYWKLTEPAVGTDVAAVCKLRSMIAAKVGGDPSFGSAHQPIRVAGSIYRKGGVERLVTDSGRTIGGIRPHRTRREGRSVACPGDGTVTTPDVTRCGQGACRSSSSRSASMKGASTASRASTR